MDFIDELQAIAKRIEKQKDHIVTEEATKTAFILPMIKAWGYDIFDPSEVIPEFGTEIGNKKDENSLSAPLDGKI